MKKLLLSIALLGLFGCSSAKKSPIEDEAAITDQAKAEIENAAENLKNEAEAAKAEVAERVDAAQETATNAAAIQEQKSLK